MENTKSPLNRQKVNDFLLSYALYIILGLMIVVVISINPAFLSISNFTKILTQASTRGILALGAAGMIVLAGTDLSAGRIVGVCAAVSASLMQSVTYASRMYKNITTDLPVIVPLVLSIAIAMVFCAINGFGVSKLNLHAFIVSLGTQLIAFGVTCIYIDSQENGAQALSSFNQTFLNFVNGGFEIIKKKEDGSGGFTLPYLIIYFAVAAVIMWVVWNKTALGKNMFAIGGNKEAAAVSGVNIAKNIMGVYLVAGVLYGVAACLEAGRIQSVNTGTGLNYDLDAISGCVIGGVSFSGGVGTIPGVVIGVVLLQMINYSLSFLGVNPYLQYIIKGLIIILAVSIDVRKYLVKK
ncbi:MAG: beta-methylgalactoside transporter [Oscillospiraceae bacterium]|jgi:methyl-galactoside transport system permease protein|nr:beta-methylgalactoside transporter [Oscillospiraceae bacterium]